MRHALLLLPLALLLASPAGLAAEKRHPDTGADVAPDACLTCHSGETPEIVNAWASGKHGLLLVKCFVCHGSTGKDFAGRPSPTRCRGCHASEVDSVTAVKGPQARKAGDCFACHAPHALAAREGVTSPHAAR